jgi:hypothetical protein
MATLRPVSNCSQCGAEARLFRADGPYCLACVDRLRPSPTKSPISFPVLQNVVDRGPEWDLVLVIVVVALAVSYLFIGRS